MTTNYKEEGSKFIDDHKHEFNLLIVTATDTEKKELHKHLKPVVGHDKIIKVSKHKHTYFLGVFGAYNAIHVACDDMGSINRNGSITTTSDAINLWEPKAVLMVGIAFGKDKTNQKIGDVLVSERIVAYEAQRIGKARVSRAKEGPASSLLLNRFNSVTDWERRIGKRTPEIIPGLILSGEKLVDDPEFKRELFEMEPTAIGGEMEGAGIYAACDDKVNHWILVKGICDYADGNKKSRKKHNQQIAIESAVSLTEYVFSSPHAFDDIQLAISESAVVEHKAESSKKKVHEALKSQVNRQIQKQINSGKYIPKTFIETGKQKDHLRYLADPILFAEKCLTEIKVLDFRHLHKIFTKKKLPEFEFDLDKFDFKNYDLNVSNINVNSQSWLDYLIDKNAEINSFELGNGGSSLGYKLRDNIEDLQCLNSRVSIITEMPGQGKTNFVCDFAENFLLKRDIPCIFLLGTELDSDNIRKSITNKIFPDNEVATFQDVLDEIEKLCHERNRQFIIIIDGLNENRNPVALSNNLEAFISEILDHDFIRVILTCRTEYYNTNFSNLENSSFKNEILKVKSLRSNRSDDNINEKLFSIYFHYFKIEFKSVSAKSYGQLVSNFLLLRIFCDSYQNQNVGEVDNIYKEELFTNYFDVKTREINDRLNSNGHIGIRIKVDVKKFILKIVEYMVTHHEYANIPFDLLIEQEKDRELYVRFLDENILVRRDLANENDFFDHSETVNFTFDEFRDFLISKYLIEVVYKRSPMEFEGFLTDQLISKSLIREGCGTFLFHASRKKGDQKLLEIIESQDWYDEIFQKSIFSLKDEHVDKKDKDRILKGLEVYSYRSPKIIRGFMSRMDIERYKNLNIHDLFAYLRTLDYDAYNRAFVSTFTTDKYYNDQISQGRILEQLDDKISKKKELSDKTHQRFEMLIYMFTNPNAWQIKPVYEKYYHRYPDQAKKQLKIALKAENDTLIHEIKSFCNRYDITL